jgi:hypothetical protein
MNTLAKKRLTDKNWWRTGILISRHDEAAEGQGTDQERIKRTPFSLGRRDALQCMITGIRLGSD